MAIHERQLYQNLSEDEVSSRLSGEGYAPHRVSEPAGATYDNHKNSYDLILAFVEGSADVKISGQVYPCKAGDRLNIPGDQPHSAVVGSDGVTYLMVQVSRHGD
jgi:quercetin dioxygenase-like cupin family protein